jgi:hypothetical protein
MAAQPQYPNNTTTTTIPQQYATKYLTDYESTIPEAHRK